MATTAPTEDLDALAFLATQHEDARREAEAKQAFADPHGPDGALGNLVVGPIAAIADRVRNALKGN